MDNLTGRFYKGKIFLDISQRVLWLSRQRVQVSGLALQTRRNPKIDLSFPRAIPGFK
ncbi:unknown protein [Simkania negevensis Z]|uniref:Uncharacterized protein n=1 Tax=Simkania negevensis (strain ATCC VR-1471 / DSM 27360 / Z) TaxID=331113 RepID=F8L550_SIMNZ|nr:unknown protein [Simkania negevensis Z]